MCVRSARIASAFLLVLAMAAPARAYDYDTHYLWTYYLALHVGYSPRQAYQIASATFAIDHDPDTGPLEATAVEAIRAAPRPGIENVWTRYHAFADARYSELQAKNPMSWMEALFREHTNVEARIRKLIEGGHVDEIHVLRGDPAMVRQIRDQNASALWELAVETGNPGPYLHFTQDIYSHWEYDSRRGHLTASHAPDYLSYDINRSREMTTETIRALQRFAKIRGIATRSVNMERVWQVFDLLVAANPPTWMGQTKYYDELLQAALDKVVKTQDPAIYAMVPKISGIGSPDGPRAWKVVTEAIAQDRQFNRLPGFPDVWFQQDLPPKWFQYDFDGSGRVAHAAVNRDRFAVEWPEIVVGDARLSCTDEPDTTDLVRLTLRVPYEVRGAASLDFQHPLPLYNTSVQSDSGEMKPGLLERENGKHEIVRYVLRPRSELAARNATWTETIAVGPGDARAVVEAPIACAAAATQAGPARLPCPASINQGEANYGYDDYRKLSQDGVADCATHQGITKCHVRCVYGPPGVPLIVNSGLAKTYVGVTWFVAATPEVLADKCRWFHPGSPLLESYARGRQARKPDATPNTAYGSSVDPEADQEAVRLGKLLVAAALPYTLRCPGGRQTAESVRVKTRSWLRPKIADDAGGDTGAGTGTIALPPEGGGTVRISVRGRVVDARYEPQTDERGVPIDVYFYPTPTVPGWPVPSGEQQWSKYVRVPSARSSSTEPAVWWHARWEYGAGGWVYVQEKSADPPHAR